MSILRELQRRNVLRVAAGYIAVSWLIVQVMDTLSEAFALTGEHIRVVGVEADPLLDFGNSPIEVSRIDVSPSQGHPAARV